PALPEAVDPALPAAPGLPEAVDPALPVAPVLPRAEGAAPRKPDVPSPGGTASATFAETIGTASPPPVE
ncbi:translation initiation factor IF-2, partial [Streptomyces sp. Act-28]